ncbi:hypothetical protein HYT92_01560 [Candidatus Pacearchaeota archaeon]|nr:hypothetical protein [Candidatus Pacearchaeota archaeon]
MASGTETVYKKNEALTTYGEETGCAGCRTSTGSLICENCFDEKTGRYKNFQPEHDYWRRV